MLGSVPRPEITGNDLRDLVYYIRRQSYAGAYPTPITPGPDDPDTGNYPTILTLGASRVNSTTITVTWTTDKSTIGFAGACSLAQAALGLNIYNQLNHQVCSPIESAFSTNHSVTISGLPTGTVSYIAVAKDHAGNITYSNPLTI